MSRNFDFSQAANKGITVLPDTLTVPPLAGDLVSVSTVTGGNVQLGFAKATASTAYVGDTPPVGALDSALWWDSAGTGLYIRYNDGSSTQWVVAENQNTLIDAPSDTTTYGRRNGAWVNLGLNFLPLSGGILTGALTLSGNAALNLQAVPLQQLNSAITAATAGGPFLPLSGGTLTGSLFWTSTGGTTSRAAQARTAEVINVRDFGAAGDGVTNDTAAINAALDYIRAHLIAGGHTPFCLTFPYGRYVVTAPLNFTGLASFNGGVIDGQGSEIWAKHTGVVIDCLGSRWLRFRDFTVFGDPATIPRIGIQIGRATAAQSADYHSFYNVQVWGSFSFTALYNGGSETCGAYTSGFRNDQTGANKFCMVLDGLNHWNAASTFVAVTLPVETNQSFNEGLYSSCTWQGSGNSGVVWLGTVARHHFLNCYASCTAGSIFTVYQYNGTGPAATQLDIDCHCETAGLQYAFLMTGAATRTFGYILGFNFQDHSCQAASAVFAIDPGSSLTSFELRRAKLNIYLGAPGTAPMFDVPSKWSVRAEYAALHGGLGATLPAVWTGPVVNYNAPNLSYQTLFTWTTGSRPTPVPLGTIGYATDTNAFEIFDNTGWHSYATSTSIPVASSTLPIMDGTATIGVGTTFARADHIHPTDNSRAPTASPTFTGTVTAGATNVGAFTATGIAASPISGSTGSFTTLGATGTATLSGGGTLTGTFAGTPTFSGALTLSAAGTALSITNNATISGTLTLPTAAVALYAASGQVNAANIQALTGLTVGTGLNTPALNMLMDGAIGSSRRIMFRSGGSNRWFVYTNNTAEGGSNAGSDFAIDAYSDAGGYLSTPLTINRSTGATTLTSLTVNGGALADALTLTANNGISARIQTTVTGVRTWNMGTLSDGRFVITDVSGSAARVVIGTTGNVTFTSSIGVNGTAPPVKPTVSGAKGSNAALASLMTALVAYGFITDSTTA